jgi:hypothetical protein
MTWLALPSPGMLRGTAASPPVAPPSPAQARSRAAHRHVSILSNETDVPVSGNDHACSGAISQKIIAAPQKIVLMLVKSLRVSVKINQQQASAAAPAHP